MQRSQILSRQPIKNYIKRVWQSVMYSRVSGESSPCYLLLFPLTNEVSRRALGLLVKCVSNSSHKSSKWNLLHMIPISMTCQYTCFFMWRVVKGFQSYAPFFETHNISCDKLGIGIVRISDSFSVMELF